jgi:SNF2 family DNA or RNA helicase
LSFIVKPKKWEPHEYQMETLRLMVQSGGAGLLLDPGLGKTSCLLAAFKILRDRGFVRSMLVIAPRRVCHEVWPLEVEKWANFNDLKVVILQGSGKDKAVRQRADVYVMNPESLPWFLNKKVYKILPLDMLGVDEATKFKNPRSQRFKLLKSILNTFKRRYILTGTPMPKGLMDLFGQIYIIDHGTALGQYITHYRNKYFDSAGYGGYDYRPKEGAFEQIAEKISGFCIRLKAEDYIKLPELIRNPITVSLPDELRRPYKVLEDEFFISLDGKDILAPTSAATSNKLRQFVNGRVYDEDGVARHVHNLKAEALYDLIEQLQGAPALVLYQFKSDIDTIRDFFKDQSIPYIGSGISDGTCRMLCSRFNDGTIPILLAHPDSVGHGLNLQGRSNHVVFYSLPWSVEHFDQALRRVYRQGNPNTHVYIHTIALRGTIDERVAQVLQQDGATQEDFLALVSQLRKKEA